MATSNQPDQPSQSQTTFVRHRNVILILAAVVAGLAAVYWALKTLPERIGPKPEIHVGVGKPLTYLKLLPLTGGQPPVALKDLADHVTLLNFWGTWCPPCRAELPHIAELRQRYAGHESFRILAVSYPPSGQPDDVESLYEETVALLERLNLDLPTYYDPDAATRIALDNLINFEGYPTTLLLDRNGVIRAVWVGYRPGVETEMERHVDVILDEERGERGGERGEGEDGD